MRYNDKRGEDWNYFNRGHTVIYTKEELEMSEKDIWVEIRRLIKEVGEMKGKMMVLTPIFYLCLANFLAFIGILIAGFMLRSGS